MTGRQNVRGLHAIQPAFLDARFQLRLRERAQRGGVRIIPKQRLRDHVHAPVRALCGENRGDQRFKRI